MKNRLTTLIDLACQLGCTAKTLRAWRRLPGAPRPDKRGHDLAKWRKFVQAHGLGRRESCDDPDLVRRKLIADVHLRETKVAAINRELIPMQEIGDRWRAATAQWQTFLRNKFENELPPVLVGKTAAEIRKIFAETLTAAEKHLRRGDF